MIKRRRKMKIKDVVSATDEDLMKRAKELFCTMSEPDNSDDEWYEYFLILDELRKRGYKSYAVLELHFEK